MTIATFLKEFSSNLVLSPEEKTQVDKSRLALASRVESYFVDELTDHFRFGSSTRNTILPRKYDLNSDIDYMVVFTNKNFSHQTYLNRLKRFVNFYYPTSSIYQSFPSITLKLGHIYFDLVPAVEGVFGKQIPDKNGSWIYTYPHSFNSEISDKNTRHFSLIKPAVRLIKKWNAAEMHPYESFFLETKVVEMSFAFCYTLKDVFKHIVDNLSEYDFQAEYKKEKVRRLKRVVNEAYLDDENGYPYLAESEIKGPFSIRVGCRAH